MAMDDAWVVMGLLAVLAFLAVPVVLLMVLLGMSALKRRVAVLEAQLAMMRAVAGVGQVAAASAPQPPPPVAPVSSPLRAPVPAVVEDPLDSVEVSAAPSRNEPTSAAASPEAAFRPAPPPMPRPPPAPSGPNAVERIIGVVKQWFSSGNVPVKVGMLVLLAGVAALLKYVSDQGWLTAPIELRLAGIAAVAMAGLVFGWRQREARPLFALALQGGAIGALLLTVFAAFKLYGLMPALAAFALSIVLIAGLCVLAVLQNSRTLAVLGILAGFLAPIWLSTGSGNHVGLFSYYAVLNAGVFAIAWVRPWRVLNLLGFAFTFGIGTFWGVAKYVPEHYGSTQPFLLLFFAFYLLIPILYARRQPAQRRDLVDGSLVFGTPLLAFSLQAGLLDGERLPLALCALALAALYAGLAWALIRRERFAALGQCHAVLAVGFATLAIPLALSARATASVFALEGAALVWLGLRQHRRLPEVAGIGLQLAAAFGFLIGADYWRHDVSAFANASFMSAMLLALAGFASAWCWRNARNTSMATLAYLWGLGWWLGAFVLEVERFVRPDAQADALLVLAAVTGVIAAEVHRRWPARALSITAFSALVAAGPLAMAQAAAHQQPFAGYGALAWVIFAVLGVRSLICLRASADRLAPAAQFVWWLIWPLVFSLAGDWLGQWLGLAEGWQLALTALPWLLVAAATQWRWPWIAAPLGEAFAGLRTALQCVLFAVLGVGWLMAMLRHGAASPLPWVPLLNPLELAQLAVVLMAAHWLWSDAAPPALRQRRILLVAASGFLLLTVATLRAVHHWGGIAWDEALWGSMLAQTSLTVVWSLLGVVSWILGSRRGQRMLWLVGAVLMGVVLAKLVLVDMRHLGNLLGISSFLAYGLLCTAVGYFAPAPPRVVEQSGDAV
jgi:uncharacterized membrane protein